MDCRVESDEVSERARARDSVMWGGELLGGTFLGLSPLPKRLGFPVTDFQIEWEAGDSALGRFPAINWTTDEYLVEDTVDFLSETNPCHREIVICDSEQLDSASVVALWGEASRILLMGADSTNVAAWASKDVQERGGSLVINKEAENWIAKKRWVVGSFYIRSGRKFSDDWVGRAYLARIVAQSQEMGFYPVRFRARWNELIEDWNQNQSDSWANGPNLLDRRRPQIPWEACRMIYRRTRIDTGR